MPARTLIYKFPAIPNVTCAFQFVDDAKSMEGNISYRHGERGAVLKAREELLESLPGMAAWAECDQTHGVEIEINPQATPLDPGELPKADGLMTNQKGLGLMIKTADCQPVFVASNDGRHIMALHVGWRGNRANFIQKAIHAFRIEYDLKPEELHAIRGPSLGPGAAEFVNFETEWGEAFLPWFNAHTRRMDLWSLTFDQLKGAGLAHIHGLDICTFLNDRHFFSFRRDRRAGRQASLIWITP